MNSKEIDNTKFKLIDLLSKSNQNELSKQCVFLLKNQQAYLKYITKLEISHALEVYRTRFEIQSSLTFSGGLGYDLLLHNLSSKTNEYNDVKLFKISSDFNFVIFTSINIDFLFGILRLPFPSPRCT